MDVPLLVFDGNCGFCRRSVRVMTERIRDTDTAGDLLGRLAEGGAGLLVATLDGLADGSIEARQQPEDGVSFAPKILVEDARVDWRQPAALMASSGFAAHVGAENICPHFDAALERAAALRRQRDAKAG